MNIFKPLIPSQQNKLTLFFWAVTICFATIAGPLNLTLLALFGENISSSIYASIVRMFRNGALLTAGLTFCCVPMISTLREIFKIEKREQNQYKAILGLISLPLIAACGMIQVKVITTNSLSWVSLFLQLFIFTLCLFVNLYYYCLQYYDDDVARYAKECDQEEEKILENAKDKNVDDEGIKI